MEYYAIVGMVIVALGVVIGLFASIKKSVTEERRPIEDLNLNIVRLNSNFEHMLENDVVRDKRIEKHGQEIDEIKERQQNNEKLIDRHESRIRVLEGRQNG